MPAELERPFVDGQLMPADAGRRPRRARQHPLELRELELEHLAVGRQRARNAEHELHVHGRLQQAVGHELGGVVEHREIEDLDLGLDVVREHARREVVDQRRMVFVDDLLRNSRSPSSATPSRA